MLARKSERLCFIVPLSTNGCANSATRCVLSLWELARQGGEACVALPPVHNRCFEDFRRNIFPFHHQYKRPSNSPKERRAPSSALCTVSCHPLACRYGAHELARCPTGARQQLRLYVAIDKLVFTHCVRAGSTVQTRERSRHFNAEKAQFDIGKPTYYD
jgi:hypothetical protein